MNTSQARNRFLKWVEIHQPQMHKIIMENVKRKHQMHGLGDIWDTITETAEKVLPMVVQAKAQKDIFKAQLKRAEKGLAPLNTEQIAPTLRVQADIAPTTRDAISTTIKDNFIKYGLPVGIALTFIVIKYAMNKKK